MIVNTVNPNQPFYSGEIKKFLHEITVNDDNDVIKKILENCKIPKPHFVVGVYIDICQYNRLEKRICLTDLRYEKIEIFVKNNGQLGFMDMSEGDDCCNSCIIS